MSTACAAIHVTRGLLLTAWVSEPSPTPLEHSERAEAGGIGQRLGFRDAAAAGDRREVADVGALTPLRPSPFDELVEPIRTQPVCLGTVTARRGQLIDCDLTGDVLRTEVAQWIASASVGT